jgi:hypothetical protein
MLSGQQIPENASGELRAVNDLLAVLRALPVEPVERSGQARAFDAYRETFARSRPSRQRRRRRPTMLGSLLGAKIGAALAAGGISLGGVAAAAYTGVLPAGLQEVAHNAVGAPAAGHGKPADHGKAAESTKKAAVGPDATGHAAFGLCTAWWHVQAHGNAADKAVAFRNLTAAAGGAHRIAKYCAKIPHPGATGSHPSSKPSSKPSGVPSHAVGSPGASHRP